MNQTEELRKSLEAIRSAYNTSNDVDAEERAMIEYYDFALEALKLLEQKESVFQKVDVALRRLVRRIQGVDIYDNTPEQQTAYLQLTGAVEEAVSALKNNQEGLKP